MGGRSGQLDVMRKDLRAWILITEKNGVTVGVHSPVATTFVITDTGKTPAENVCANLYIEVVPNGQSPHFESTTLLHMTYQSGAVLPSAPLEFYVARQIPGRPNTVDPLTDGEREALNEGAAYIAAHGVVTFDDTFHKRHWVKFCYWTTASTGTFTAQDCSAYNHVDE